MSRPWTEEALLEDELLDRLEWFGRVPPTSRVAWQVALHSWERPSWGGWGADRQRGREVGVSNWNLFLDRLIEIRPPFLTQHEYRLAIVLARCILGYYGTSQPLGEDLLRTMSGLDGR